MGFKSRSERETVIELYSVGTSQCNLLDLAASFVSKIRQASGKLLTKHIVENDLK